MTVVIGFPLCSSVIEFEPFLGENMEIYQEKFDEWYAKNYSPRADFGKKKNRIFDVYVVVDWIKEVAPEANPVVLVEEMNPSDVDPSLPGMYF